MIFEFKTEPYDYQRQIWENSRDEEFYALFMEQGTGKTKVSIDTASWLFSNIAIEGMLIIAPNGVHSNWVLKEIPIHCSVPYICHNWTGKQTKKEKDKINVLFNAPHNKLKVLAMNIESIRTPFGEKVAEAFVKSHRCLSIVDESTIIKNHKALQSKKAYAIGKLSSYRRILSGTPVASGPLAIWGQCMFLHPNALAQSTYTAFKNQFAVTILDTNGGRAYEKIIGYQNIDRLTKQITDFSVRVRKSECLDLPDKVYQEEIVPMTVKQEKAYKDMKDLAFLQLEQGLITSTQAITTMMKLHQIVNGFVIDDEGTVHDLENNRLPRLKELIERIDGKVIVWAVFKHSIQQIKDMFGDSAVTYYGDTDKKDRDANLDAFRTDPNIKVMITNKAGSRGLTLVESSTSIYFTNSFDLETRQQSEDRNHRIGQKHKVLYIDMITPNTIDSYIVKKLKEKEDVSNDVMNDIQKLKDIL